MIVKRVGIGIGLFVLLGLMNPVWAQALDQESAETEIDEEFAWLREEAKTVFVVTASRVKEDIRKSTASITVVTAEQIREMGARDLADALRAVPGMNSFYHVDGHFRLDARGVTKSGDQNVLVMLNSHPLNSNYSGGATWVYDTMTVDNIQRIEVIRGPGSALYGANAFSGVINVITKKGADIDGFQVSASTGSEATRQYNFMGGQSVNDFSYALNVNLFDTDGQKRFIQSDTQTLSDRFFGTQASFAPDYAEARDQKMDIALNLQFKGLQFDGRLIERTRGPSADPLINLDKTSNNDIRDYYLNLSYERQILDNFNLTAKLYRNSTEQDDHYQSMMNGAGAAILNADGSIIYAILPDEGLIADVSHQNFRTGFETQATYDIVESNTLVAGFTYEKIEQKDTEYSANFMYTNIPNVIQPLPDLVNLTDIQNVNQDADRHFLAFFAQDIWDITEDIRLTVGARFDDYDDVGSSFNPRAGVAWAFIDGWDLKLMYGRAFRAPAFQELYSKNNPSLIGNPDLDPETVDTYEASIGMRMQGFSGRLTGFYSKIEDDIRVVPLEGTQNGIYGNKDELRSQGFEMELKYDFGKGTYVAANYTYQDSENRDTGEPLSNIAKHTGDIMLNIPFAEYFNWNVDFYFQDGFERESDDPRDDVSGYGIVNTTLIAKGFLQGYEGLELRGSVYNLFNEKWDFPYQIDQLPDDLQMAGASGVIEIRYTF